MSALVIELHHLKTKYEAMGAWHFVELINAQILKLVAKEEQNGQ